MIYEFLCTKCGIKEDISLSVKNRNKKQKCKKCGNQLCRLIGNNLSFNFKGKGFYKEGYN